MTIKAIARKLLPPKVRFFPHRFCGTIVDLFYGIRTEGWYMLSPSEKQKSVNGDGFMYQTCSYSVLWEAMRRLPAMDGAFYDLGCGKARAVYVAARSGKFTRAVGVELVPELAEAGRRNVSAAPNAEIITADVLTVDFSDGAAFFFNNPFGKTTLYQVLDNIARSRAGKLTYIVVYSSLYHHWYDAHPFLRRVWASKKWGLWQVAE